MKFGDTIKSLRIDSEMTLRQFAKEIEMDPSNWSKIERNIIAPPQDEELQQRIITALSLDPEQAQELSDMIDLTRGQIPSDLQDEELMAKMPAFFRAMRGQEYTAEDFEQLKKGVKALHSE
jgi:transcriptional regulator with XRE-family HTH domain